MSDHFDPCRQVVAPGDPEFSVRIATFDDLLRLQREARDGQLNARWSSDDALRRQVEPNSTVVLAPLLRNGREHGRPDSYRCHIWFVQLFNRYAAVSLFDVTAASLFALLEVASPEQLNRLVRMLLDGVTPEAIW